MRAPERKTIGNDTYEVKPLPAGQGIRMLARLGKILGPGVDTAVKQGTAGDAFGLDIRGVISGFGTVAAALDPVEFEAILREFAATTTLIVEGSGKPTVLLQVFDLHFAGRFEVVFEWIAFALEVNFGPLLDALGAIAPARAADAKAT